MGFEGIADRAARLDPEVFAVLKQPVIQHRVEVDIDPAIPATILL